MQYRAPIQHRSCLGLSLHCIKPEYLALIVKLKLALCSSAARARLYIYAWVTIVWWATWTHIVLRCDQVVVAGGLTVSWVEMAGHDTRNAMR